MIREVLQFIQRPVYEEDENHDFHYRLLTLGKLILWALGISFAILSIISLVESVFDLNFGKHASEDMLEKFSTLGLVLLIVVAAPLIEELIFRGPLYWFRNKASFRFVLYLSIFLFGSIHLFNFEDYTTHWWMAPFLVTPQLSLGAFAAFIRVRFGLLWAMALHAGYNLIIALPLILVDLFNIPLE